MDAVHKRIGTMMSSKNGLPGLEVLFREQKRLATKLTSDELRALQEYIAERVFQEQADIFFKLNSLQADLDVTLRESSETITDLNHQLQEKNRILETYRQSDSNIVQVHKQRQERWEKERQSLKTEIAKYKEFAYKLAKRLEEVESELSERNVIVEELERRLGESDKMKGIEEEAILAIRDKETQRKEILKLKLEIEKRDRALKRFEREMEVSKNEHELFIKEKKLSEIKIAGMKNELQKQVKEVALKCTQLSELQKELNLINQERLKKMVDKETTTNPAQISIAKSEELQDRVIRKDVDLMDAKSIILEIKSRGRKEEIKRLAAEVTTVETEERIASELKEKLFVYGKTPVEQKILELVVKIQEEKKSRSEELRLLKADDNKFVEKDATVLRAEALALRKQAQIYKCADLVTKMARIIQRLDAVLEPDRTINKQNLKSKVLAPNANFKRKSMVNSGTMTSRMQNKIKADRNTSPEDQLPTVPNQTPTFLTEQDSDTEIRSISPTHIEIGIHSSRGTVPPVETRLPRRLSGQSSILHPSPRIGKRGSDHELLKINLKNH